jgi:hypothetical protein
MRSNKLTEKYSRYTKAISFIPMYWKYNIKNEIAETFSLTLSPKRINYLGINFTKRI